MTAIAQRRKEAAMLESMRGQLLVDIRSATAKDLDQLIEIDFLANTAPANQPWGIDLLGTCLDSRTFLGRRLHCTVATPPGKLKEVLGYCWWTCHGQRKGSKKAGVAHLYALAVHPSCWRRGIGEQLLHTVLAGMVQNDSLWATAAVGDQNLAAQCLLKRNGFVCECSRSTWGADEEPIVQLRDSLIPAGDTVRCFAKKLRATVQP